MQDILQTAKGNILIDYEDKFMSAIVTQLRNLQNHDLSTDEQSLKTLRALLTLIDAVRSKFSI